ncbi:segregation and condensation protein B [Micromonospora viridifaciens]|uniref:Segregation and condensation protein B n=1 Tax=Micromonospora viridifaciens TaxID=1881 RepID=A0A1C4YWY7_MICVI|nr:SMC-Scp complex subunit ScpB [Micromonospora viridifaciens]SCF25253.1 segregation and condensation protein B [Micromonospora viridifaciens]
MSDEERRDSLADQAAAWIPPWQRPAPTTPTEQPQPESEPVADLGSEGPLEGPPSSTISTVAEAKPQPAADLGMESPQKGPDGTKIPEQSGGAEAGEEDEAGVPTKRGRRRATAAPEPAPLLDDAELRGALEAILLVVDQPVSELTLAQVLEQPPERIGPMLDDIAAGYTAAGHGFELRRAAGGWRLYTRPEYASYVERFVLDGQSVRLTQAALETLAVVAYKQPVTRSRISAIRGVNCDGVLRTLVSRGLVEECGTEPDSGAFLYRTTTMFLEKLGLNSVDDLPPLAPFLPDDVEELADATR